MTDEASATLENAAITTGETRAPKQIEWVDTVEECARSKVSIDG